MFFKIINRRYIRTRVIQFVYSNSVLKDDMDKNMLDFINSISNSLDLLYCSIDLIKEIKNHFLSIQKTKKSFKNISENPYFIFFSNIDIPKKRGMTINWELNSNYIDDIKKRYIENEISQKNKSNSEDLDFFIYFFSEIIWNSEILYEFIQDQNITWTDDIPIINSYIISIAKEIDLNKKSLFKIPRKNDYKEEIIFGEKLISQVFENKNKLKSYLDGRIPNWDTERIAQIDLAILISAIAELVYFPLIPVKVTMNEYIEISKEYSSPKSSVFINGVLDKIIKDLTEDGTILKTGRGLIT
ncbi:MAG: transcription antitermination factor NusB [Euryarchaeota archaeon]|nr:transcription antitermination factor NusB [Euryarchaeota archaeon]